MRRKSPGFSAKKEAGVLLWLSLLVLMIFLEVFPGMFVYPDLKVDQEQTSVLAGKLDRQNELSQSFISDLNGLCAVDIFARVPPGQFSAPYALKLALKMDEKLLAEQTVLLKDIQAQPRVRFVFPMQRQSSGRTYTLVATSDAPPDTLSLLASQEDVYWQGELRQNNHVINRDLAIRAYVAITPMTVTRAVYSLRNEIVSGLGLAVLASLAGCAILIGVGAFPFQSDWSLTLSWALGIGLSVIIVLFSLFGSSWFWGMGLLVLLALGRSVLRPLPWTPAHRNSGLGHAGQLLLLFMWALVVRMIQVQSLPAPLWVDGVRHFDMINQIIAEGRLPTGLLYHTGYHSLVAISYQVSTWLPFTHESIPRLMLLIGQWCGALGAITIYPLARKLSGGSHAVAILACVLISLVATFPSYLFNWGRYPFELGLALLPLTLAVLLEAATRFFAKAFTILEFGLYGGLTVLLLLGMGLAHYGMLSFVFSFGVVWLIWERPTLRLKFSRKIWPYLGVSFAILVGTVLGMVVIRFGTDFFAVLSEKWLTILAQSQHASTDIDYREIIDLQLQVGRAIFAATGIAAGIWAWFANRRLFFFTVGWFLTQAIVIGVQAPFLGYALASYGNLLLALAMPFSLLIGPFASAALQWIDSKRQTWPLQHFGFKGLTSVALATLALWGGLSTLGQLNPRTVLMTPGDKTALQWLRAEAAENAVILINSNHWGTNEVVPSDGGAWINAFTSRKTIFLDAPPASKEDLNRFLNNQPVDYIYLGRFSGFLSNSLFADGPFETQYQQDGITIYKFLGNR